MNMKGKVLKTNMKEDFYNLEPEFQRKVLISVIKEQEFFNESLALSTRKHYILVKHFVWGLEQYPDIADQYNSLKFQTGTISKIDIINTSINKLIDIQSRDWIEKIDERWDPDTQSWVVLKRQRTSNCANQLEISKFLLENNHLDYDKKKQSLLLQTAFLLYEKFQKVDNLTEETALMITDVLGKTLRASGIDIDNDQFSDDHDYLID